ncbi:MAG: bifunctional (p)ppGpp synthetase/guanosine-3',5'-bis(diphosphate) 3'-pyrophosphohydrolase [Chloroflexi bacterium]|nr:bifunctional (p)ppGpp synthetase/guanosine-3',5'-bis(diphosphate) 3'-pyrophosphohydrolase [Chloroflexota bacterium]
MERLRGIFSMQPGLTPVEHNLIEEAYVLAAKAHETQFRDSGKPYITHPVAVAEILAELNMDAPTIAAALLHDVVEDTDITLDDIERQFGQDVALLVNGVTKIKQLPTEMGEMRQAKKGDLQAEYLRQMFMAMGNDVRVILVKLADRLDNMRTLGSLSRDRQTRNARETLDIFAPLANRLGIGKIKWQLEDLSFRYLEPERYKELAEMLASKRQEREDDIKYVIVRLEDALRKHGIEGEVRGRPKHIYSIYRKMKRKEVDFEHVFDVRALRVMVPDVPTCYQVLGIVHQLWRPIHGEFDDYIAAPKENGYQSLHTAVIADDNRALEVQIRTHDMHQDAEYGIAAHWKYKEKGQRFDAAYEKRINYMRRIAEQAQEEDDPHSAIQAVKEDITDERIYVFTPKNDIIDLPAGSTPIDFAYHIHTDIGNRCRGARIGGKQVGLDYRLQTGDRVEIVTANRGGPSLDWLNEDLGFVKTHRARQKIRQWFRKQDREKNITNGREALERELKRMGLDEYPRSEIANATNFPTYEHILAAIGYGDITASSVVAKVLELERREQEAKRDEFMLSKPTVPENGTSDFGVDVDGLGSGGLVRLATCCSPLRGDPIIGFITRTNGITIHRTDCKNILNTTEPERLIVARWSRAKEHIYSTRVEIRAHDREGLMRDIGAVIAAEGINMTNVNISTDKTLAIFSLIMEVNDKSQLLKVVTKIDQFPDVIEVRRLNNL